MDRSRGLRVVAFGGGTGLPVLLQGLRDRIGDLVAVVTVADDGGSSGRLRQELGVAPPGDVRNCLVALSGRRRLAEVFNYRFEGGGELSDHSVGNIIIAALSDLAGGFGEGVEQAARFLRIKGRVFPAATESLTLVARYDDGTVVRGESAVSAMHEREGRISLVSVEPEGTPAPPGVIEAVENADVVVLSSGSLYTSTIPSLDRKSTRLNSSHANISYAVFCLKKKKIHINFLCHSPLHPRTTPLILLPVLHSIPSCTTLFLVLRLFPFNPLQHLFFVYIVSLFS